MRAALVLSFLSNLILSLVSLSILPDRIAIHFGPGGAPNGWASNLTNTLIMLCMQILVFCALYFAPKLLERVPSKWISLPNRDFWLMPQHRSKAVEKFSHYMWQFGTALFLFMLFVGLLTFRANLSDPIGLDESLFLTGLAIFLAYTLYWTVVLLRSFRVPKET